MHLRILVSSVIRNRGFISRVRSVITDTSHVPSPCFVRLSTWILDCASLISRNAHPAS